MMAALQVCISEFHPREVYELKVSQGQQFTSGIHRPNGRVLNINLSNPTGQYMYHQFNIQNLYALTTLYLYALCGSEINCPLFPNTTSTDWFL